MSKIQYPYGAISVLSDAWVNLVREGMDMNARQILPLWQAHPSSSSLGDIIIGAYDTASTSAGRGGVMCPVAYNSSYDTGAGHKLWASTFEAYANWHELTDSGDGLTFEANEIEWVEDSGDYAITIKSGGSTVDPADYTIDYAKGKVTFDSSQSGNTITWQGYFLASSISYTKDYDNLISCYTPLDTTLMQINPYNFRFDHWPTSTTLTDWTKTGTIGQQTAYFKPVGYDVELTATAGITKISQTLSLGSAIDQMCVFAIARASNKMQLRVSMDSGVNWSTVAISTGTQDVNKWVCILVQSETNSTTTPIIEFSPQILTGDTGTARVAMIGGFLGGLIS